MQQTRAHNKANEIDTDDDHGNAPGNAIAATTGHNWVDPIYDAPGNMTSAPWASGPDPWGGLDEQTWCHGIYDAWNRLVVAREAFTFGLYGYDGLGRRIWRIALDAEIAYVRTDAYYSTQWQVLEERTYQGPNADTTVATDLAVQWVWGARYVDAPLVRWRDNDANPDLEETLYLTGDANFNVTALVSTTGTVVERYVYDPYGKATVLHADWSSRNSPEGGAAFLARLEALSGRFLAPRQGGRPRKRPPPQAPTENMGSVPRFPGSRKQAWRDAGRR